MNHELQLKPGARRPHRVVVLTGSGVMHRHTCATLLRAGVNVVGIVTCRRSSLASRVRQLRRWVTRDGVVATADQLLARASYRVRQGDHDVRLQASMVNDVENRRTIGARAVQHLETDSYSRADTLAAIAALTPDILVVHSPFIVGRKVRALAPVGVIGGHPGITPFYRGSYSAFWALTHGRPEMVGWTVFVIDDGIDTGPIIEQGALVAEAGDSHMTLTWKGMIEEAAAQVRAIRRLDEGVALPLRAVVDVPPDSYFGPPSLRALRQYWRRRGPTQGVVSR